MNPLLKYPGGKRKLVPQIAAALGPISADTLYVEPFFGSGAVFLGIRDQIEGRSILSDVNPRLMAFHAAIRDDVPGVLRELDQLPWGATSGFEPTFSDVYYFIRDLYNGEGLQVGPRHAARLIWLNHAGFNGLYRENASGGLNVPCGRYAKIVHPFPGDLVGCAKALAGAKLRTDDFDNALAFAESLGYPMAIYADPPYIPAVVDGFSGYSGTFGLDDHRRLAATLRRLAKEGHRVVASNHDLPVVRELYAGFEMQEIAVQRSISRKADGRKPVGELLMSLGGARG